MQHKKTKKKQKKAQTKKKQKKIKNEIKPANHIKICMLNEIFFLRLKLAQNENGNILHARLKTNKNNAQIIIPASHRK